MIKYDEFVEMVNAQCLEMAGISIHDLPDNTDFQDYWYEDMTPAEAKEAAKECAEEILVLEGYDLTVLDDDDDDEYKG